MNNKKYTMVMKKYLVSIASLAAMVGLVACQKTEIKPSPIAEGSTFTLAADIEQTKTTLNDLKVNWEEGDILYLVTKDGTWGNTTSTIAEYTYSKGSFESEATINDGSYTFNALYDGSKSQKGYHKSASTTYKLQSTQNQDCTNPTAHLKDNDALVGSFTADVPRTTPASVNMSHIFAIMRVDVKNATGAPVELRSFKMSAAGANLAGVFTVNFANSPIDITAKQNLSNSITVNLTNGTVANGSSLPVYFVMAPLADYSGDVTFTVTDTEGKVYTKKVALSHVTFNAGSLNTTPYKITTGETTSFVKVTSAPTDWSGEYLIVYEEGGVAFDGSLTTLDAASNTVAVSITDSKIKATKELLNRTFTINEGGKTIQSKSGYYIGQTSNANGLKSSTSTSYANTLSITANGEFTAVSGGAYLRYNNASNQHRFRYYKSSSYKDQKAIQLYKLVN